MRLQRLLAKMQLQAEEASREQRRQELEKATHPTVSNICVLITTAA